MFIKTISGGLMMLPHLPYFYLFTIFLLYIKVMIMDIQDKGRILETIMISMVLGYYH